MALGKHTRTASGRYSKERDDSLIEKLKKEYPVLAKLHGNTKTLGGAKKSLGVDSLAQVPKVLRQKP